MTDTVHRAAPDPGGPAPIRVIIADDHDLMRSGIRATLAPVGDVEVVGEAADGRGAVELYGRLRPDVALLDLQMPGLGGIDATREIRRRFPNARVVILTTYDTDEDIELALQAGAAAYLLKDVRAVELAGCLRTVVAGQMCVAPAVAAKLAERVRRVQLTARELEVLKLLAAGGSNKQIGNELGITESTVKLHANNLFQKLGVSSRTEAMKVALQRGLIRLDA